MKSSQKKPMQPPAKVSPPAPKAKGGGTAKAMPKMPGKRK